MVARLRRNPTPVPKPPLIDRWQARRAGRAGRDARLARLPEPRLFGSAARGADLVAGTLLFGGHLIETTEAVPWDLALPDRAVADALHGFGWLDDLAALGGAQATACARAWADGWLARFGRGAGPGWRPHLAGRRALRLVGHGQFLLPRGWAAEGGEAQGRLARALACHNAYLARRWSATAPGPDRLEALTGLIATALALGGGAAHAGADLGALAALCRQEIDAGGGIASRNPEALAETFATLVWIAEMLAEADLRADPALAEAILRLVPTLRGLRHADGRLARFHGGGGGAPERIDRALAAARLRGGSRAEAMGFARLAGGRTTVIVDAAPPPGGAAAATAHASTLALEVTSGRRPLIVNCGSGARFGPAWQRAGRATPSHSTLGIDGVSSARFGTATAPARAGAPEPLADPPREVRLQMNATAQATNLMVGHDGYVATHGLTHVRRLSLSRDGRSLSGQDTLGALTAPERATLAARLAEHRRAGEDGIGFALRFHLHPDVDAALAQDGDRVTLALPSGERWEFAQEGPGTLSLAPSIWLEPSRLRPLGTLQIVVAARVADDAVQIGWTLAKAADTPRAIRDHAALALEMPPA